MAFCCRPSGFLHLLFISLAGSFDQPIGQWKTMRHNDVVVKLTYYNSRCSTKTFAEACKHLTLTCRFELAYDFNTCCLFAAEVGANFWSMQAKCANSAHCLLVRSLARLLLRLNTSQGPLESHLRPRPSGIQVPVARRTQEIIIISIISCQQSTSGSGDCNGGACALI